MEVFPLEDVATSGDVGAAAVSQVEQMKSWDDSFTQLEKALQAAYETKEVRPDVSNFNCQIPATLTVSTTRAESPSERHENKRKWGDICSPESDDSSRSKFKRSTKLLPGGVTITLVGPSTENQEVSDTLMRLVADVKDSEQITDVITSMQNSKQNERDLLCTFQDEEKLSPHHILSDSNNLLPMETRTSFLEKESPSQIPSCEIEESNLFDSKNFPVVAEKEVDLLITRTDSPLNGTLYKDAINTVESDNSLKNENTTVEAKALNSSIWDSILQENDQNDTIKNVDQPPDLSKTVEEGGDGQSNMEDGGNGKSNVEEGGNGESKVEDHEGKMRTNTPPDTNSEKNEQTENSSKMDEQPENNSKNDEQIENSSKNDEQLENSSKNDEHSEKSMKKDDQIEKNSKKDDKLKKKKFERCNIRDIKLEDELDAVTLSAQKEEQERIKRLQEAQMRALQERLQIIEVEKEALSQLFSQPSTDDPNLFNATSDGAEASEEIDDKSKIPLIKSETDVILLESSDEDKKANLELIQGPAECEENVIDISSSSSEGASDSEEELEKKDDDIMVLSDEGEVEAGPEDPNNSGAHTNDCFNLLDHEGRVLVNVGHPPEDPDIFLAPQIAKVIKPHQIGGIRFLYDNVVENLERYKSSTGFGCILAHSMGLGKTVQVVSFVDVFLRHTPATLVLCIVPINTIQNTVLTL